MTDDNRDFGLEASSAFRAYLEDLRDLWQPRDDLARKHGIPAGNGNLTTA